ncbi:hypothetical protein [Ahrensia kielensis]|uniref:hypothetical protein n=1 Tax=Ahrensia kielensis TaxID=76980 RepID=UPI000362D087|nr:hypothetical protein [Ahrensia kielensis]
MQNNATTCDHQTILLKQSAVNALIAVVVVYMLVLVSGNDTDGIKNSDDIMRLVALRDFASGQSWFDPIQYRLGLDGGTLMHWSRLVDGPLWAIYSIAAMFTNTGTAEEITLFLWPAITLFFAIFALNIACVRMGNVLAQVPVTLFGAAAFMTSGIFGPTAIDHHNIQVALCMLLVAMLVPCRVQITAHALAGAVAVLMLAVGMETLPYVTIAGIWVTAAFLTGIINPRSAFAFGLSLSLSALFVFAITIEPKDYGAVYCDAYSVFHIGMCSVGGFVLALAARFATKMKTRLIVLALGGAFAAILLMAAFPQCLSNPLSGLDPKLKTFWLDGVIETRSFFDLWSTDPYQLFGVFGLAIMGLFISIGIVSKTDDHNMRYFAIMSLMLIGTAIAVTFWQQRGMLFASAFAVLPLAFVFTALRTQYHATNSVTDLLKMIGMGILSLNVFWWIAGAQASSFFTGHQTLQQQASSVSASDYCFSDGVFAPLAKEPKGVVLGATDIGANILKLTYHRALAGPYHRNTDGNLLMIEAMLAKPDAAYSMLKKAGVTLIADCINSADAQDFKRAKPDGLQAQLHQGNVPTWLEIIPETIDTPLVVYRFKQEL